MYLLISKDTTIKGIRINGVEYKISQFADDTTVILDGTRASLSAALHALEMFRSMSGLTINAEKTNLIWIGKKRYSQEKLLVGKKTCVGTNQIHSLGDSLFC